jgi:hypothetical protein
VCNFVTLQKSQEHNFLQVRSGLVKIVVNFMDGEIYLNAHIFSLKSLFKSRVCLELEDVLNLKYCGIYLNALVAVIHSVVQIPGFI